MRELAAFKVDAFTTKAYGGNPAGVVPEAAGLTDAQMQAIAREMNVSETAFVLPPTVAGADLRLRYFTPTIETRLCGHATIASFHLLCSTGRLPPAGRWKLQTNVGVLDIEVRDGPEVWMSSDPIVHAPSPFTAAEVAALLGLEQGDASDPMVVKRKLLVTVSGLKAMERIRPDLPAIARAYRERDVDGIVAVSLETYAPTSRTHIRYFVPGAGIDEDPVTGTAHMALAGYLAKLGILPTPARFVGEQGRFCGRAGEVVVEAEGARDALRVRIGGRAVTVLSGTMLAP